MEWFLLYLFVMIEQLTQLLKFGWFMVFVSLCVYLAIALISAATSNVYQKITFHDTWDAPGAKAIKKAAKPTLIIGLIIGLIGSLLPTQKGLAIIVGGSLTYQAITSEAGKRIGGKAIEALEKKLDEALTDPVVANAVEAIKPTK